MLLFDGDERQLDPCKKIAPAGSATIAIRRSRTQLKNLMRSWFNCTILSSLPIRLVLLVLLAVIPALGLIIYSASEQRRVAIALVRSKDFSPCV